MNDWTSAQTVEAAKPYYADLYNFISKEYKETTCYPPYDQILSAFALTPLDKVKCVILGQDPYHNKGEAMGLAFSVPDGITIPPSLRNIYKEIHDELGCSIPNTGNLTPWTQQGVLLLNSVLTVRAGAAASHAGRGWETYTDAMLTAVNAKQEPVCFMLWGNFARSKKALITGRQHLVLESPHPSPFSADRGFFGNGHFKKCNDFLVKNGMQPINWQI